MTEVPISSKLLDDARRGYHRLFRTSEYWLVWEDLSKMMELVGVTDEQWSTFRDGRGWNVRLMVSRATYRKMKVLAGPAAQHHVALFKMIDVQEAENGQH